MALSTKNSDLNVNPADTTLPYPKWAKASIVIM
jgi:hypothetical protein